MDQLIFLIQSRETVPQAEVVESLRLFGREVLPRFSDPKSVGEAA